jgi:TusE/DsrC/DsvC family sulfur relay protein
MMDTEKSHPHFDSHGFLLDEHEWDETFASTIARQDGVGPLTETHWEIIRELRRSWLDAHTIPAISHICHKAGLDSMCMEELFHGPREAWRIAGLPDPGSEARVYM